MAGNTALSYLGPPPHYGFSILTRIIQVITVIMIAAWVWQYLGGVSLTPTAINSTTNDTGKLFNWHPFLMALAFPLLMGEALLSYRVPLAPNLSVPQRKLLHAALHTIAVIAVALGLVAAFNSHTLKRPVPTPNLYSPHSYLGLTTLVLLSAQFILGAVGFLYPKFSKSGRELLAPYHVFLGRATFIVGVATMAVGIQEKVGFVVSAKGLSGEGLYTGTVRLPAAIEVFLVLTGLFVMWHHLAPSNTVSASQSTTGLLSGEPETA